MNARCVPRSVADAFSRATSVGGAIRIVCALASLPTTRHRAANATVRIAADASIPPSNTVTRTCADDRNPCRIQAQFRDAEAVVIGADWTMMSRRENDA